MHFMGKCFKKIVVLVFDRPFRLSYNTIISSLQLILQCVFHLNVRLTSLIKNERESTRSSEKSWKLRSF